MQSNKPRLPRIERDEVVEVHEDENAHLWAVSYSDFLMALLSFFILFFSFDGQQKQKIILNLAQEFSSGSGAGFNKDGIGSESARLPASIVDSLNHLNVKVDKEKESLIILFPDDIFSPGRHRLKNTKTKLVDDFFKTVKNYKGQVNLYFEGHTDDRPLVIHKSDVVVDNFVLSSLRASTVLQRAKHEGFPEKHLFIQADSSNTRNTRSLSIRIEPRKEIQ